MTLTKQNKIAVIGLGYVGLPLLTAFVKNNYQTIGFDISKDKIRQLLANEDINGEFDSQELSKINDKVEFTNELKDINDCNIYILTVPTPVDSKNIPNLSPLRKACKSIAKILKPQDIVIFESTVYPGCTQEVCVPLLETKSGLKYNEDFFVGYSPERINVGDQYNQIEQITKVTSGSTPEIASFIDQLYGSIITAGTFKATSIKVAEASKVIENTQRDLNIALMNELSILFDKLEIDTLEVLEAAKTKWNFLPFTPGLVGGHCIGVDPYYLTYKAKELGYIPEVILAGRRINDNMASFVGSKVIKLMLQKDLVLKESKVLVMGITFKENITDIRNSKIIDLVNELKEYKVKVDVYDPIAIPEMVQKEYQIDLVQKINYQDYDTIILGVAHQEFYHLDWKEIASKTSVIYDVKGIIPKEYTEGRL